MLSWGGKSEGCLGKFHAKAHFDMLPMLIFFFFSGKKVSCLHTKTRESFKQIRRLCFQTISAALD